MLQVRSVTYDRPNVKKRATRDRCLDDLNDSLTAGTTVKSCDATKGKIKATRI